MINFINIEVLIFFVCVCLEKPFLCKEKMKFHPHLLVSLTTIWITPKNGAVFVVEIYFSKKGSMNFCLDL